MFLDRPFTRSRKLWRTQLQLANTEAEKVNLQIKFANNRLEELEKVLEQNKQGKVSGAEVQKIIQNTFNDISQTADKVNQNTAGQVDQPQTNTALLNKIVDLGSKQTAIIAAASVTTEGDVKAELEKALEASKAAEEKPSRISRKPD